MFNETEDQAWMARIAGGDRSAFEALYRAYAPALSNYLFRICCYEESMAEDGLQETFLRVWRAAPQWRGQGKVSTFLFQIAKNVGLDARSRKLREQARSEGADESRTDPETDAPTPDHAMEGAELRALVRHAVESLPDEQRVVLELVQTEGLTYREASEILDLPLGTVKSRMAAAAETLRRRLLRHVKG